MLLDDLPVLKWPFTTGRGKISPVPERFAPVVRRHKIGSQLTNQTNDRTESCKPAQDDARATAVHAGISYDQTPDRSEEGCVCMLSLQEESDAL